MRTLISILFIGFAIFSCHENEATNEEFTGTESTYPLEPGSDYAVNGTVTFKEKTGGSSLILINLTGTEGDLKHPVHLHLGNITTPDAEVYALLNPVIGKTGKSETHLTKLADETPVTYQDLIQLNACIKVHLSDAGPEKNIILAAGNVGAASTHHHHSSGRNAVGVCKSE